MKREPYWPHMFNENPFITHSDGTFLLDAFPLRKGKECYMVFEPDKSGKSTGLDPSENNDNDKNLN